MTQHPAHEAGACDAITMPQEWIDALVEQYSPVAHDCDVAIQNMGLEIARLKSSPPQPPSDAEIEELERVHEIGCENVEHDRDRYYEALGRAIALAKRLRGRT